MVLAMRNFSVTAFMCVYNEADILPWTLRHLVEQGINIHVIDNWSTDGSGEIAQGFPLLGYEKFPVNGPSRWYSWRLLLARVEELAFASSASWCIHHDADEVRRSPRPKETLLEAFARVDYEGYNAVNHKAYHFMPTNDLYQGEPETYFRYYWQDHDNTTSRQVKAWKNSGQRVNLVSTGGHVAAFPGIKIHPELFVLKHYPMRTVAQAERKVLHERMERYDPEELARNWHVQYKGISQKRDWIKDPAALREWQEAVCV